MKPQWIDQEKVLDFRNKRSCVWNKRGCCELHCKQEDGTKPARSLDSYAVISVGVMSKCIYTMCSVSMRVLVTYRGLLNWGVAMIYVLCCELKSKSKGK